MSDNADLITKVSLMQQLYRKRNEISRKITRTEKDLKNLYQQADDIDKNFRAVSNHVMSNIKDLKCIEVIEHHTFAKPDDVEDLDFPGSCREDK